MTPYDEPPVPGDDDWDGPTDGDDPGPIPEFAGTPIYLNDPALDVWRQQQSPTYVAARYRADGQLVVLMDTLAGGSQIIVGDKLNVNERYTYTASGRAVVAYVNWCAADCVGEPELWSRHQPSNRRREDGDPAREIIRP